MRAVTVRRAGPGDARALSAIGQATFLATYHDDLPGADLLAHLDRQHGEALYAGWLHSADHALWLAESATGAPVGYAQLSPWPEPAEDPVLELKRLYLLPNLHGAGGGRRLLELAAAEAKVRGAVRLLVGAYEGNRRALAFYARQGFTPCGERRFTVGAQTYVDPVFALAL